MNPGIPLILGVKVVHMLIFASVIYVAQNPDRGNLGKSNAIMAILISKLYSHLSILPSKIFHTLFCDHSFI